MKKMLFLWIAASALLFSNCSNEDLEGGKISAQGNKHVITASFEGCKDEPSTRTTVNELYGILWTEGDAFNMFYTEEGTLDRYDIVLEDIENSVASFTGTVSSNTLPLYAVFPAQNDMDISSDVLTMDLPSEIDWSENSNGPMLAKVGSGSPGEVFFKHLAALLKVNVSMPKDAAALKITSSQKIAGPCTANVKSDDPVLAVSEGGVKTIIISFSPIKENNKEQVFFVPLPATEYEYLAIELTNEDGSIIYFRTTKVSFALDRADLLEATIGRTTIDATTPTGVNTQLDAGDLEETIQNATNSGVPVNIVLTEGISTSGEGSVPLGLPMVANAKLNMTFEKVPVTTTNPLVIKEKDDSAETGANALTVAIPAVTNVSNAPSFTIELPQTTVTLAPKDVNSGTTYNEVIATTAKNTLIVGKGVTVKKLVIKAGNVEIYGTVEQLSREDNSETTTSVKVYGAGDIRSVEGIENFAIESKWDGKTHEGIELPEKVSDSDITPIYTASQFALLQSKTSPIEAEATKLDATVTKDVILHTNIDLDTHPWIGMVLQRGITFDGNEHTVSNLTIRQFVLDQQNTKYTPSACVGLFAAAYKESKIKNVTVENVNITDEGVKNAKWVGALVGYSYGVTEYTNCYSKNVDIKLLGTSAVRVGGLIGYIEHCHGKPEPKVTLTNCSVTIAKITASYSYGGLVGSLYDSVKFDGCETTGITLGLGEANTNYGYVSKFVGDVTNSSTKHNRTVIFKDCKTEDLTDDEKAALGFDKISGSEESKYIGGCKYVGIVDRVDQMTLIEIIGNVEKPLTPGEHFNIYETVLND